MASNFSCYPPSGDYLDGYSLPILRSVTPVLLPSASRFCELKETCSRRKRTAMIPSDQRQHGIAVHSCCEYLKGLLPPHGIDISIHSPGVFFHTQTMVTEQFVRDHLSRRETENLVPFFDSLPETFTWIVGAPPTPSAELIHRRRQY